MFLATIGVTICLIYRFKIERMENELRIDDKLLDYELVSIDNYSIMGSISETFYKDVIEATKPRPGSEPSTPEEIRKQVPIQRFA